MIAFLSESNLLADDNNFIVPVVTLLALASVVAVAGLSQALQVKPTDQRKLLFVIVCFAVSLRGVAIFTPPILEVDFYRYLWDGKVLASGVSPYAYSPAQVLTDETANIDSDYRRVVSTSIESESNHTILSRIHFADYTTIYPPVSQFVFAAIMKWFPANASVTAHVLWLKLVLVAFDLATMMLLVKLLLLRHRSLGWLIGYAWNPLVIKEIANSAHLDSIAVFFATAAVYFAALCFADPQLRFRVAGFARIPSSEGLLAKSTTSDHCLADVEWRLPGAGIRGQAISDCVCTDARSGTGKEASRVCSLFYDCVGHRHGSVPLDSSPSHRRSVYQRISASSISPRAHLTKSAAKDSRAFSRSGE